METECKRSVLQQKRAIVPKNFNFKKGSLLKSPSIGSILLAVTRKFCLKIRVLEPLEVGVDKVISFTPTETGDFEFSCGMKMQKGSYTVVENAVVS